VIALRRWVAWGLILLAPSIPGCARQDGHPGRVTTRVSGVVMVGGTPVTRGWVEFLPAEGTVGNLRSAPLGLDGSFTADGVAVGINRVGIDGALVGAPPRLRHCFDSLGTPIRREVRASGTGFLKIELVDEYARWVANRPPGT